MWFFMEVRTRTVCPVTALPPGPRTARHKVGTQGKPAQCLFRLVEMREGKPKWAEGVIHSHHSCPHIETLINSLGEVVVPKLFLFIGEG